MKLYFAPGACSFAPHIALHEAGIEHRLVRVDLSTHRTADGGDFHAVNPKGYVPVIELADGTRLTEGVAILQYIADQAPDKQLAPANGTLARYRLQEWLNFIGGELHKNFGVLFNPAMPEEAGKVAAAKLTERLTWVDSRLAGQPFLMGDRFTVADAYLYTVTNWAAPKGIDLAPMPELVAFRDRIAARHSVQGAVEMERAAA